MLDKGGKAAASDRARAPAGDPAAAACRRHTRQRPSRAPLFRWALWIPLSACFALGALAADPGDEAPAVEPVEAAALAEAAREAAEADRERIAQAVAATRGVLFRVMAPMPAAEAVRIGDMATSADPTDNPSPPRDDTGHAANDDEAQVLAELAERVPERPHSLILGTIHFGSRDEQGMDWVDLGGLLDGSRELIVEAEAAQAWTAELDTYRLLPPGVRLSQLIGRTEFAMAESLLPDFTREQLDRLKPWAVLAVLEARGERPGGDGLDGGIVAAAAERGLALLTLETLEDQLRALDCVSYQEQALVLEERLKAPWLLREMSDRALRHYHDRNLPGWLADVDRMIGLGAEGQAIERRARECLIEQRNARWMPALIERLRHGGSFVAVGALHLVGEHGLLAALVRAGYSVEIEPL